MRKHRPEAKRFYNSKAWKDCRASYIATIWNGLCEHCKDATGYIVDHIIEINEHNISDPMITLNHDNLQYLCLVCHNKKTFEKYSVMREDVRFDLNGDIVPTDRR